MPDVQLEVLVEEPSAEQALNQLIPAMVPGIQFKIRPSQGKHDLLHKLPNRLRGYRYLPQTRIIVLVDLDRDDCIQLKERLERVAVDEGVTTLRSSPSSPQLATRIAIHELEAWFFGDVPALAEAYPRVPATLAERAAYRDPDAIDNTWERLEHVLQDAGHHRSGLRKMEAAARISAHMNVERNQSDSFCQFRDGLRRLVGYEKVA